VMLHLTHFVYAGVRVLQRAFAVRVAVCVAVCDAVWVAVCDAVCVLQCVLHRLRATRHFAHLVSAGVRVLQCALYCLLQCALYCLLQCVLQCVL